jgi:IS5 family transposase
MYLVQIWFNLSDEGVEDAIYDSYAMRKFVGVDFTEEQAPDATTLLKFRHRIEKAGIGKMLFDAQVRFFEENGFIMKGGTIVDATLIAAPPSTKNAAGERDPEMHSTKKGSDWHFGMKCHAGADAGTGIIHSIEATAANVHDIDVAHKLLRDDDEVAYGDSGYIGIEKRPEIAGDERFRDIEFRLNRKRGALRKLHPIAKEWEMHIENRKSATRSKVEHVFHIIKNYFGFRKVRYRGIAKNLNKCYMVALSANWLMLGRAGRLALQGTS